eukprot:m.173731 g.173731  ORF g.173731 m.173731 type:complete len:74 (-) comp18309_c0_seq3:1681-1902(-)
MLQWCRVSHMHPFHNIPRVVRSETVDYRGVEGAMVRFRPVVMEYLRGCCVALLTERLCTTCRCSHRFSSVYVT